jgi:hypothetical protein
MYLDDWQAKTAQILKLFANQDSLSVTLWNKRFTEFVNCTLVLIEMLLQ